AYAVDALVAQERAVVAEGAARLALDLRDRAASPVVVDDLVGAGLAARGRPRRLVAPVGVGRAGPDSPGPARVPDGLRELELELRVPAGAELPDRRHLEPVEVGL